MAWSSRSSDTLQRYTHDLPPSQIPFVPPCSNKKQQLKRIGATLASLNATYASLKQHINASHLEAAPVLEEASDLLSRKAEIEKKQALLSAFRAHFILSEEDLATLTSTALPVDASFFAVLTRAKRIHSDCSVLLAEESHQRLGLEILSQMDGSLDLAYQKLFRWTTREFKSLNLENPILNARLREGLRVLAERPSLFQSCLDAFAEAREGSLMEGFYFALTGQGEGGRDDRGGGKPIEAEAGEPLRYVSDMVAWVHSATVSEREALEVLFIDEGEEISRKIQKGRQEEHYNYDDEDDEDEGEETVFDGRKALNQLVDIDVSSVARLLKQRIEQVIHSLDDSVLIYKITNLLTFYLTTFGKILAPDSVLLSILHGLEESGLKQFKTLMRDKLASLGPEAQPDAASPDLSVPDFFTEALRTLTEIMKTYDSSIAHADARARGFRPILDEAYEPYYDAVQLMSKHLPHPEQDLLMLNCLLASKSTLQPYDFVASRLEEIDLEIEAMAGALSEHQYNFLVRNSGIAPLLAEVHTKLGQTPKQPNELAKLAVLQPKNLETASALLDSWLPSALMDAMEQLGRLNSARIVREVTEEAVERFVEEFERLEEVLLAVEVEGAERGGESDDEEGRGGLTRWFPRTSGEIRVLLT